MLRWRWSVAEVEFVLGELGLSTRLLPFELPYRHADPAERVEFERLTRERLRSNGTLSKAGRWDPDVEALLRLLAGHNATAVLSLAGESDGEPMRARGAYHARAGVGVGVGVRLNGDQMRFTELDPAEVVGEIVDLLPMVAPGGGKAVTVPLGAAPEADEYEVSLYDEGRSAPRDPSVAARELLSRPKQAWGQFDIDGRNVDGKLEALGQLGWFDTEDGRWMSRSVPRGNSSALEFCPADNRDLATEIGRRLNDARR